MPDREKIIKGLKCCKASGAIATGELGICCGDECRIECPYSEKDEIPCDCVDRLADDVITILKVQEPCEDWISRKRLKDEIKYYIDEAGWSEEVNKALGWCLEFIDNQKAVTWNDAR